MSLPYTHKNFINDTQNEAAILLAQFGILAQLDTLWNGVPDFDAQLTQAEIDSNPVLLEAGLTVAQITDAVYAMSVIKGLINDHMPTLALISRLPTL